MLRHLLKIAIRNFRKNRFYTSLNMLCLAIGICFCLFTAVYIDQQFSINQDLKNADRQVILKTKWRKQEMGPEINVITNLAKGLREEYPHIVSNYYRFDPVTNIVSAGDRFFEEDIAIGDTTLVGMYGFEMIAGNRQQAFENNSSAVITETLAKKLFDADDAIGKTITIQTTREGVKQDYKVSAVLADIPANSVTHIVGGKYSVFLPFAGNKYYGGGDLYNAWDRLDVIGFVELQAGKTMADLQRCIDQALQKNSPDYVRDNLTANPYAVSDYHLQDNNRALLKLIMIVSLIALFVLGMVIINFINITIGSSTGRLKEIALKKTFGSGRQLIVRQFILESFLLAIAASLIALVIYQGSRPLFTGILQTQFPAAWNLAGVHWIYLGLLVLAVSMLAGIYPALVLSKTNLINAVKGKLDNARGGLTLRRVLLVTQFSLAIFVFICAVNISKQVKYIFSKDPGYKKEQLLIVTALPKQWDSAGLAKMETIKQGFRQLSGVKVASLAFDIPDHVPFGKWELLAPKSLSPDGQITISLATVDEDYAKTLGLRLLNGSFFENGKDGIVLNEAAVSALGETADNIIGKKIKTIAGDDGIPVRGVVADYNYASMQDKIAPAGFVHVNYRNAYRFLLVRLNTNQLANTLTALKEKWRAMSPNTPFNYSFMDEKFAALYKTELQLQKASGLATVLNFVIVLLGITGVVAFMLQKKVKEIAVRKVLGARAADIIALFLKEYAGLIVLANLLAWPMAYFVSEKILQQFAYRTNQAFITYIFALAIAAMISFLLIGFQCFRTALEKPVKNLKTE